MRRLLISLPLCLMLADPSIAEGIGDILGHWRTVRHGALVEIVDCGNATPCGVLAEGNEAAFAGNTHDSRNRNPALRARPLLGLPVLWGFQAGEGGWRDGMVYNPEDGRTFSAQMRLLSHNELRIIGCLGPFCRSQIWSRITPY